MTLFAGLDEIVTPDVPLAGKTWMRLGGPARLGRVALQGDPRRIDVQLDGVGNIFDREP